MGSAAVRFYFRCVVGASGRASDCRRAMRTVIYSGVKIMVAPLPALDPFVWVLARMLGRIWKNLDPAGFLRVSLLSRPLLRGGVRKNSSQIQRQT